MLIIFRKYFVHYSLAIAIVTVTLISSQVAPVFATDPLKPDFSSANKLKKPGKVNLPKNNSTKFKKDLKITKPEKVKKVVKQDTRPIIKRVTLPKSATATKSFSIKLEASDDKQLTKAVIDIAGKKDTVTLKKKKSGEQLLTIKRDKPGKHKIKITVYDSANQASKTFVSSMFLKEQNQVPKIVKFIAPSTLNEADDIDLKLFMTDDISLKQLVIKVNNVRKVHSVRGKKSSKSLKLKSRGAGDIKIEAYVVDSNNAKSEVVRHTIRKNRTNSIGSKKAKSATGIGAALGSGLLEPAAGNKPVKVKTDVAVNSAALISKDSLSLKKDDQNATATTRNTSISTLNKPDIKQGSNTGVFGSAAKGLKVKPKVTQAGKVSVNESAVSSLSLSKNAALSTSLNASAGAYAFRDPETGSRISGTTLLTLPNGRRLQASEYYRELERMDRAITGSGLTSVLRSSKVQTLPRKPTQTRITAASGLRSASPRDFSILPDVSASTVRQLSGTPVNCDAILDDGVKTIAEREACKNVRTYKQGEVKRERQRQQVKELGRRKSPSVRRSVGLKGVLWGEVGYSTRVFGASNFYGDNSASNVELSIYSNAEILGEDFSLLDGGCSFTRSSVSADKTSVWLSVGGKDVGTSHNISERFDVVIPLAGIDIVGSFVISGSVGVRSSVDSNTGVGYLDASCEPYANTGMTVEGGVSALIATAGLGADLMFLEVSIPLEAQAGFKLAGQQPQLVRKFTLSPTVRMLDGELYAFVDIYVPVFDYPPWEEKRIQWDIVDWSPLTISGNAASADEVINLR